MTSARNLTRIFALLVAIGTVAYWATKGCHTGWSMDRIPVQLVDEVTELEYTVYEERFVPGIDTLAVGLGVSGLIFGITLFLRRKSD